MPDLYDEIVDAIHGVYGAHPGHRAQHAKGVLCAGIFTATPEAAALTRAPHLQGEALRAHARFSNGSGKPESRDGARDGRGLAVKLYLPEGGTTDIVCSTLQSFPVRTPEEFLELTSLRKPDPETGQPDFAKLGEWLGEHPEAQHSIQNALALDVPTSYAQVRYNGLHAFHLLGGEGDGTWVRWWWEPEPGEAFISDEEAAERDRDFLRDELEQRLAAGPAAFRLHLQLAADGDPLEDPTAPWPDDREDVVAGRLEVTGLAADREQGDDVLVFDPTRVPDGIECSDDPILHARARAYAASVERRSGAPRPAALA